MPLLGEGLAMGAFATFTTWAATGLRPSVGQRPIQFPRSRYDVEELLRAVALLHNRLAGTKRSAGDNRR
jgi:hypothetical protein